MNPRVEVSATSGFIRRTRYGTCGWMRARVRALISLFTQRPLVDSAHKVYEITPQGDGLSTTLVIDGQVQVPLRSGDRVTIRRGKTPFPMVRLPGHSFYRTLRDKLGWGALPTAGLRPIV